MSDGVCVRPARSGDLAAVLNVLDGAALETDAAAVRASIDRGEAFVAVAGGERDADEAGEERAERVLGALVRDGDRVETVAVRRRRRGQGIGRALIERAARDRERLTARFDADVRPFYAALGFEIEAVGDGRCRGERRG